MTKIAQALAFLEQHHSTAYAAAKHAKLHPSALYAYLRKRKAEQAGACPTCGRINAT